MRKCGSNERVNLALDLVFVAEVKRPDSKVLGESNSPLNLIGDVHLILCLVVLETSRSLPDGRVVLFKMVRVHLPGKLLLSSLSNLGVHAEQILHFN